VLTLTADISPAGMPMMNEISVAASASWIDAGSRWN
jgi:hypothetical protein